MQPFFSYLIRSIPDLKLPKLLYLRNYTFCNYQVLEVFGSIIFCFFSVLPLVCLILKQPHWRKKYQQRYKNSLCSLKKGFEIFHQTHIYCKASSHLLSIYKSQIRPFLEYCSHVWGGAPKSTLCLLDKVQSKAVRLINNPNLTKSLQPLSHRGLVGDLSIFYRYFNGHCSQEIRDIIPVPLMRFRTTRSSTHSHPFQVSLPNPRTLSHKSSFIPRTCNLWNVLPSSCFPESYNLPSFKSNVNKLDLISLSS